MGAVDSFTPVKTAGAGVVLSAANPKNLVLAIGAAAAIAETDISVGQEIVAYAIFVLIGTIGVGGAGLHLLRARRARARPMLDGCKTWMAPQQRRDHGRAPPRDRREADRRRDLRLQLLARVRLPVFTSLTQGYDRALAARRPDRRADGLGGARARGARLRVDRGRLAGRRPLRRARRADPLRRVRQLAAPRHRADGGDRGAVGRGRRRPRRGRLGRVPPAHDHARARRSGSLALVAGLARLGFLASFISEPVLKGFIVGLALTIIVGQVPKLLGVPTRARATSSSSCGTCSATSATRAG